MRDFVLHQAEHRPYGLFAILQRLRNWQARRSFAHLTRLNDYQLKDIGLSREELCRLAQLPLSVDPVWEAERLRLLNARQRG